MKRELVQSIIQALDELKLLAKRIGWKEALVLIRERTHMEAS